MAHTSLARPWWVAAVLLSSAGAAAQTSDLRPDPLHEHQGAEQATSGNALGSYAGVKPGGGQPPAIRATPGATPAAVTWPGFQMQPDGSSRVFLQTTAPVATETQIAGKQVIVGLAGAKIAGDTNALPLDTRFFNSPVTRIALRRDKGRLQLVLDLRTPVTPSVTTERAPSGFHFIYVDFPAGSYAQGQGAESSVVGAPPPAPDEPANKPAAQREAPSHLSGEVRAGGKLDSSMDNELPPGMGEVRGRGKASTSKSQGKAGGKVEGKAGFSL